MNCLARKFILFIFVFLFISCNDKRKIDELFFIGDSHVEYWDVQYDFPEFITHNYGVSGSGIALIKQFGQKFSGKTVVAITGTNDIDHSLTRNDINQYVEDYITAIINIDAEQTILVSIFPQASGENPIEKNKHIREVNTVIKSAISNTSIYYIDIFDDFEKDGLFNPSFSNDGRHPNRQGYEIITKKIRNVLR